MILHLQHPGAFCRKILFLTSALVLLYLPARSQKYEFNPVCRQAWDAVMMFRFNEAGNLLHQEKILNPDNLMPVYIENYIDFLILFTGEDPSYFNQHRDLMKKRIDLLSKGPESSPYYRFCLADLNIQWAFARLKFREYATAGLELKRANELLKENHARYPAFMPDRLGLGIMNVLAGIIPDNYKWLASMAGLGGNIEQGAAHIQRIIDYQGGDPFICSLKSPACIVAALINVNLRNNPDYAMAVIARFDTDPDLRLYAQSPLVIYAKANIYLKTGHNARALAVLSHRGNESDYRLSFLDYQAGTARLNNLDPGAAGSFRKFLAGFRGTNYIKSSWQKIAWTSLLAGDTASYRKYIRQALSQGSLEVDEDKQAAGEASSGLMPCVPLLKARLLFDGGYYQRALETLLNNSLTQYIRNKSDLAEYYYRLGRIYQSLQQSQRALTNFRLAVKNGQGLPQYYAAGAALQMGIIHEQRHEYASADSSYRLCLSMDYREYKTSLGQKARAGLNRVKKHLR